jgi:hypothetical protein
MIRSIHTHKLRLSLNSIILLSVLFLTSLPSFAQSPSEDTTIPRASLQSFINQTHFGGYGEMSYTNPNYGDVPRLSIPLVGLYLDHYFNDKWSFMSEFDVEDVQVSRSVGGTVGFQQAYLDYHPCSLLGWRTGLLLIPMGIINQEHDPTTYFSVERPLFDQQVIPTTWREIGTGIYGNLTDWLNYQLYVTEGLQANGFTMNSTAGGRQDGSGINGSDASHPAISGRIAVLPIEGMQIGASLYYEANAFDSIPAGTIGTLIMIVGDARYERGPLHIRAEYGMFDIGPGGSGTYPFPPSHATGGYGEIAYNVFSFCPNCKSELLPFVRYENFTFTGPDIGTYAAAPAGPMVGHTSVTAGLAFKPLENVIFKADYRMTTVQGEADFNQLSLGGGFSF